ncbi:ribosome-inactivating family protein [Streptomyces sp. NPDC004610]|uniref:ribosome-inactivating family protein n=1 Tax=unclassified Streptomyces TaxID=2593676 RepID=UPI0033A09790
MSENSSSGPSQACAFRHPAESLWRATAVFNPVGGLRGMVAPADIHAYRLEVPYKSPYRAMIKFLRARFASYTPGSQGDARFFRVEVTLVDGQVRLYFLKENLYLEGWSILHLGTEHYFAVDKIPGMTPQGLNDAAPRIPISLAYTGDISADHLSGQKLLGDLQTLYHYLRKIVTQVRHEEDQATAEAAFHRTIRMTAEMARFGGFHKSLMDGWPAPWSQGTVLKPVDKRVNPDFSWAVNSWDALSRKLRGEANRCEFEGLPVPRPVAELILDNGAPTHPR